MSPFTRILSPILLDLETNATDAYAFDNCILLGVSSLPQILGFALLLAPGRVVDALRALRDPMAPNSLVHRLAPTLSLAHAHGPYVDLTLPMTVLSVWALRVRPTHVASELEVFWTGRGGSFALSFLALSLSARVLLVFVLFGLG